MRTLDRDYLATHPEGDEKAVIEMTGPLRKGLGVADNPDGSRPRVTLKATGDTYSTVLYALGTLVDNVDGLAMELLVDAYGDKAVQKAGRGLNVNKKLGKLLNDIQSPFRTFHVTARVTREDGAVLEVDVKLTGPSVASSIQSLAYMVQPQNLTQVAIGFCPETDDDDEYGYGGNEVLVVS